MTIAGDFAALMAIWGQALTIVTRSVTYSNTGQPTVAWVAKDAQTGMIEPYTRKGETKRVDTGILIDDAYNIYLPAATLVQQADRIRPAGWIAGQDEYEVFDHNDFSPSHLVLLCSKVKGHDG